MFALCTHRVRRAATSSVLALAASVSLAGNLESELGRNEVRVRSAQYPLLAGRTVSQIALVERLERLGYERVPRRPEHPGHYFYGHEVFWIYRRFHRANGRNHRAALIGLRLRRDDGMIVGGLSEDGREYPLARPEQAWLEPETVAESLDGDRADRIRVDLADLPEHVWRAVLAAEDARFFEHGGLDARSLARAALANVRAGEVVQGGSTITQQLIKNRDLSPRRTMGRKVSEAARALALEADYDKREILEAYLNQVYLGHVDGLALHGVGTAARAYFSTRASGLTLAEAATLAAMIQGPNRLSPSRHPERVEARRDWVLSRMEELGWAEVSAIRAARRVRLELRPTPPTAGAPRQFLAWVSDLARRSAPERIDEGRGIVAETTLDPWLQQLAEREIRARLGQLRRDHPRLSRSDLSAVLVALDPDSGAVLAYVGGDPLRRDDEFDRVRMARRQPGSTLKPLVLLEAFESCGQREPLYPATRVADEPVRIELPGGDWQPANHDGRHLGTMDVREALADSRNVPFVRIARWCGLEATARRIERAGLELPETPPPSFVLGSVETTPLDLASAYTVLANPGKRVEARPLRRIEKPGGSTIAWFQPKRTRVVHASTAYLVRDVLVGAVARGTARVAAIDDVDVAAKTGTTRDAWFVGHAESLVTVVWIGLDGGDELGLSGAAAAGPLWKRFMSAAVPARPARPLPRPRQIVERTINTRTGLLVRPFSPHARSEIFRKSSLPPRNRFWRSDSEVPVVR